MRKLHELYYMTQYASYMSDEAYYQAMSDQLQVLDSDVLSELMTLAPYVEDKFNEVLFDLLFRVNNDQLQVLVEVWEFLKDGDIEGALNVLDYNVMDLFTDDDVLYTFDILEAMADEDLKTNGIHANAISWYKELERNSGYNYYRFNGYLNGFYYYDDLMDAVDDVMDFETIKDIILNYFNY